jgi:hypothetical protein
MLDDAWRIWMLRDFHSTEQVIWACRVLRLVRTDI